MNVPSDWIVAAKYTPSGPGQVKVGVESPHGSGSSSTSDRKKSSEPPVTLPEKYRDPETSGLKYSITSQTKELYIEIE